MKTAIEKIESLYDWRHSIGGTSKDYSPIARADVTVLGKYVDLANARVCDVGCGDGTHLLELLEVGARFPIGIDLSGCALLGVLERAGSENIQLVRGDVTLWLQRHAFDAVLCSLPPLTHHGRMSLQSFTKTLHTLLGFKGVLFFKTFTLESAHSIVGTYEVKYEGAKTVLRSEVSLSGCGRLLRIEQKTAFSPSDKRTEEVVVSSCAEVGAALNEAGFSLEAIADEKLLSLPGTRIFVARV